MQLLKKVLLAVGEYLLYLAVGFPKLGLRQMFRMYPPYVDRADLARDERNARKARKKGGNR